MMGPEELITQNIFLFFILFLIGFVWSFLWKGLALYKAGKLQEKTWFVCLLIFNTLGILPIIYLILRRNKK